MLRVRYTLNNLREYRDLFTFYFSLFFLMAGVYIVITYTFIYGEQVVGWSERGRVVMFGVVQLSAAFGALFFGFMQDKIGLKKVYVFTLLLWIIGILSISSIGFITRSINSFLGRNYSLESVFVLLGLITGISLGASQSAGRAIVGVFTPASKAAEFFGFWGLFNKFAGFVGIIGMGLLQAVFGLRLAILFCAFLFAAALIMTIPVNISRGIAAAGE